MLQHSKSLVWNVLTSNASACSCGIGTNIYAKHDDVGQFDDSVKTCAYNINNFITVMIHTDSVATLAYLYRA